MFEGLPIIHLDEPNGLMLMMSIIIGGLISLLRHSFPREWRLGLWAMSDVRRIWQRSADEAPRTGGVIIGHVLGILALGLISMSSIHLLRHDWSDLAALKYGIFLGIGLFILRQITGLILGRFSSLATLSKEHLDIDRLLRTWMTASMGILALFFSMRPQYIYSFGGVIFIITWGLWTLLRWWRVFKTSWKRLTDYWLGILYLCALEIFPTFVIIKIIMTLLR